MVSRGIYEGGGGGILSPVPEFTVTQEGDRSDSKLPEFDEQDYNSHRNVYVAVHVPYSVPHHHHHRKHRRRHRKKFHIQEGSSGRSTPMMEEVDHLEPPKTPVDPCDRVKFILGEEGEEVEHESHHIFTELEELCYSEHGQNLEWKETARWVKFEEDVEEGGEKWSKPHVATLSLHSLFDLRSCMLKGTVLLDVLGTNLEQISDIVLDHLVSTNQLEEENRDKVRVALLHRHRHHCTKDSDKKSRFPTIRSLGDIVTKKEERSNSIHSHNSILSWLGRQNSSNTAPAGTGTGNDNNNNSQQPLQSTPGRSGLNNDHNKGNHDDSHQNFDHHFMKKLLPGSEASNVLVGEVDFLKHSIIAFVRLSEAQMLGDLTEVPIPTRFLFILLGPKGNHARYHQVGRAIATLMADEVFHEVAYKARNRGDLLAGVDEFLDKVTVLPPGEWDPDIRLEPPSQVPSQSERRVGVKDTTDQQEPPRPVVTFSKIPFKGLFDDAKRRYKHYLTDFRDAAWDTHRNKCSILALLTTIASIIFIYFANIAPAITFGQVLSEKTGQYMGAVEMIISVSIGNFVYSLTAGQPLVVLGGTGPTLIFEDILFQFCSSRGIPYLEFRFWIGLWTAAFLISLVALNASVIMRIFTRFTEEIFSALISFIFIYEAFEKIWKVHLSSPYNGYYWYPFWTRTCNCYEYSNVSDVGQDPAVVDGATNLGSYWSNNGTLLSTCREEYLRSWFGDDCDVKNDVLFFTIILFFGTFAVAFYFKRFKETPFFPTWIRKIISDFSVLISVIIWVLVSYFAHVDNLPTLQVPDILSGGSLYDETTVRKSFLIHPFGNGLPGWAPVAAILPALLATILLFMDQQITALIVNRKDNKLLKGSGYHLDMFIVACLVGCFSCFGLPWVVGATVRSIAHVQSLFLYSPSSAPGERPKFLGVKEQRITLLSMAVLLGISILLYQVLKLIPLAVLYGLFLYIGVTSLFGVQFVQRILIIFMPDKYKPDEEYVRHIPNRRLHSYTLVQILMLLILCLFKVITQISIVFPVMVLLLVFGRWLVGWCFPRKDLLILDDPIPDKLYCKRNDPCCKEGKDIESGIDEIDARVDSIDTGINITREVDRCDLWQHMVHKLDKEPNNIIRVPNSLALQDGGDAATTSAPAVEIEMHNNEDGPADPVLTSYKSTEI